MICEEILAFTLVPKNSDHSSPMNTRLVATLVCVAALAFACGPRARTSATPVAPSATTAPAHATGANVVDSGMTKGTNEETITTTFEVSPLPGHVDLALG